MPLSMQLSTQLWSQREPEPELMDGLEQVEAYAEADFTAGDQRVVERLADLAAEAGAALDQPGALLADLGCGPGNISFRLAARWPHASVVGIDGAATMLAVARRRLSEGECPARLSFALHVLPDDSLERGELAGACTALVSNSLLHHLHEPRVLWRTVRALAAPGAFLYLKDLRRPASAEAAELLRQRHLPEAPPVLQHDYMASLRAAFTVAEVREQLDQAGLDQLQVAEADDRYLEVWGCLDGRLAP